MACLPPCPLGKWVLSYLPSKKIFLSWTTAQDFFEPWPWWLDKMSWQIQYQRLSFCPWKRPCQGGGGPMSPVWILKRLMSVFINALLLSALPSMSQFGEGRLSLVEISFYALSLLFGLCHLSEFTVAGPLGTYELLCLWNNIVTVNNYLTVICLPMTTSSREWTLCLRSQFVLKTHNWVPLHPIAKWWLSQAYVLSWKENYLQLYRNEFWSIYINFST